MANFEFNTDRSNFNPFSLQEMLVPFTAYKEAYDKAEAKYDEMAEKASAFDYLRDTLDENSKARQIYEKYANDLRKQAEDFQQNGFYRGNSMNLTSLKRRYSGEIGRLVKADELLKEIKKQNRVLDAQDNTRLYAKDNPTIDDVLDGENYNPYVVSGKELYARGAAAASAASKRIFNIDGEQQTLGGYYRDFVQRNGYSPETINAFREKIESIPELAQAVNDIDKEYGVSENLSGNKQSRARQSIINGMLDGAIYTEAHNPTRDLGVLSAEESKRLDLAEQQLAWEKEKVAIKAAITANAKGKVPTYGGTVYIQGAGGGVIKPEEGVPYDATKISIVKNGKDMNNNTRYEVYIGTGKDRVALGSIDSEGNFTATKISAADGSKQRVSKVLNPNTSWLKFNDWDEDYDPQNVTRLGGTLKEIVSREGISGLYNYNYYFYPDNADLHNHGGGIYIEPLKRDDATVIPKSPLDSSLFADASSNNEDGIKKE